MVTSQGVGVLQQCKRGLACTVAIHYTNITGILTYTPKGTYSQYTPTCSYTITVANSCTLGHIPPVPPHIYPRHINPNRPPTHMYLNHNRYICIHLRAHTPHMYLQRITHNSSLYQDQPHPQVHLHTSQ